MASRRNFLKLLGISPLAAKASADEAIGKQISRWGINGFGDSGIRQTTYTDGNGLAPIGQVMGESWDQQLIRASNWMRAFGVPEYVQEEYRERAKYVSCLDPDIACKKSWSMSVKIMTQRQRNYERCLQSITMAGKQHVKKNLLKKTLGFNWPW